MATDGTAYVGELEDNGPDANTSYQVQVVGGGADGSVIPVDDITHLSLTQDGQSLYAGDQTVSLSDPTHPVSVNWPQYGQVIAVGSDAVYATPQTSDTTTDFAFAYLATLVSDSWTTRNSASAASDPSEGSRGSCRSNGMPVLLDHCVA